MLRVSGQSVHSWPDVQCSNTPQLTWTLWPAYHGLQGRWQQAGTGELGPARAKDQSVCLWLSWFPPATREGRECWKETVTSHQSRWRPAAFTLWWGLGGAVSRFLRSFLFRGRKTVFVSLDRFFEPVGKLSKFLWWGHEMWVGKAEKKKLSNSTPEEARKLNS